MASLEFPGNNTTSVNQTRTNTTTSDSGSKEESKWRSDVKKLIEGAKNSITKSINTLGSKTEEVSDTIVTEVFGSGLLTRTLNDSMKGALKSVGTGIGKSASFIWDKISASKKDDKKDEKKRENKLITAILAPIRVLSKMFKFIQNSLTWIAEKGVSGLGKTLKYILIGAGIFIKWLKNWLMKSILFKALGKIGGLAWEGIKGVVSIGGELASSIASALVGYGAGSALTKGIKAMTAGMTASAFMPILAGALAFAAGGYIGAKLGTWGAEKLYETTALADAKAVIAGESLENVNVGNILSYGGRNIDEVNSMSAEEREIYDKAIDIITQKRSNQASDRTRNLDIAHALLGDLGVDISKYGANEKYNAIIKALPSVAKSAGLEDTIWTRDMNDDGFADYTQDRFETLIKEIGKQYGDRYTDQELRDVRRRTIEKNTAGVTST